MNEVICHGIPDTRELEDGDLCNGRLIHGTIIAKKLMMIKFFLQWTYLFITVASMLI